MTHRKILIASDHAGFEYKKLFLQFLEDNNFDFIDLGPHSTESTDYPLFAQKLAENLTAGTSMLGVLICGTGLGMSMSANRFPHIRAALCHTEYEAKSARAHNIANVLCIGERVIGRDQALAVFRAFLKTPFEGGRHQRRLDLF